MSLQTNCLYTESTFDCKVISQSMPLAFFLLICALSYFPVAVDCILEYHILPTLAHMLMYAFSEIMIEFDVSTLFIQLKITLKHSIKIFYLFYFYLHAHKVATKTVIYKYIELNHNVLEFSNLKTFYKSTCSTCGKNLKMNYISCVRFHKTKFTI